MEKDPLKYMLSNRIHCSNRIKTGRINHGEGKQDANAE
jgi:hypothetical protein